MVDMAEVEKEEEKKSKKLSARDFVTWDELCSEDVERDQDDMFLPRYGKYIRHRTKVPLDRLLDAQRRFLSAKKRDTKGYFVFLLKYLILNPRADDQQARVLLKADGRIMLNIIGSAVGDVSDLAAEMEEQEEEAKK